MTIIFTHRIVRGFPSSDTTQMNRADNKFNLGFFSKIDYYSTIYGLTATHEFSRSNIITNIVQSSQVHTIRVGPTGATGRLMRSVFSGKHRHLFIFRKMSQNYAIP